MFKRILIAYNGSAEGKHMLSPSTKGMVAFLNAEVHLLAVAVATSSTNVYAAEGFVPPELIEDEKLRAQEVLDEGLAALRARGFTVTGHLAVGDPVEEISRTAGDLQCDLIVVGHTQRSWMSRWWQRSIGKSLLDTSPCAVLVIRPPA
jgi:nucleotide-binding universal stress UspA family protein